MRSGDRLATFGPAWMLPRLPLDVGVLTMPFAGEEGQEAALRRERPEFVVVLPDSTSAPGMELSGTMSEATYQRLRSGTAGYVTAATFVSTGLVQYARLDYPTASPPIRVFMRRDLPGRVSDRPAQGGQTPP
jgi:hypothetical protein